ncbi:mitochondrial glycoprotein [Hypoxylon sp. NC1633]|nr:mitochondrial glycoprotein [Hypoxylon sp. NC1633]
MMSLRAVARSAPRTFTRLSSTTLRQSAVARPSSLLKSSLAPLRSSQCASAFSTSQFRQAKKAPVSEEDEAAQVDEELSVKLESEIQFEGELKESEDIPASVKDFLENSPFELKDIPGKEEVTLTRKFGNETITVTFSIHDLVDKYNDEDEYNPDEALGDEEGVNTPEPARASPAEEEEGEEDAEDADTPVPCKLDIVVEKPGVGALNIEALAHNGEIMVDNFYFFKNAKLARGESAELAHEAQDLYPGPPFGSLDEDLQVLMERYLEERGITQALAVFVPDYMDIKEQREYQTWLRDVKAFVDA